MQECGRVKASFISVLPTIDDNPETLLVLFAEPVHRDPKHQFLKRWLALAVWPKRL